MGAFPKGRAQDEVVAKSILTFWECPGFTHSKAEGKFIMNLNVPRLQGIGQFLHYSLRVGRTQFLTATH